MWFCLLFLSQAAQIKKKHIRINHANDLVWGIENNNPDRYSRAIFIQYDRCPFILRVSHQIPLIVLKMDQIIVHIETF